MSAPELLTTATSGIRSASAVRAATSHVIDCAIVSGLPLCVEWNSTQETRRPPSIRTRAEIGAGTPASKSTSSSATPGL